MSLPRCRELLTERVLKRFRDLLPHGHRWRRLPFGEKCIRVLHQVGVASGPAAATCMVRLLLGGTLVKARGQCPWSSTCPMSPSGTHALLHGCWWQSLRTFPDYEWVASADPDIALKLIDAPTPTHIRQLSLIVGTLVECAHLE
eukprot:436151-Amphidinium_carterae.1